MVLAPAQNGVPVRFRVKLDGAAPGRDHGFDCSPDGAGAVRDPRLYQLVRQAGRVEDRTFPDAPSAFRTNRRGESGPVTAEHWRCR